MATSDEPLYATVRGCNVSLFSTVTLRGNVSVYETESFLGVPYAHTAVRWTPPVRLATAAQYVSQFAPGAASVELDCTRYGPRAAQDMDDSTLHWVLAPWFARLSNLRRHGEHDALHLNVYRPPRAAGLPVLVYFHGGGFVNGDNSAEFDGTQLVVRAAALGKPVIVVSVNYRLNTLGFFSSPELEREPGFESPNFGLLDQRAALRWVRDFIPVFGGDSANVTVAGESAGAMSCMVLAQQASDEVLFDKMIVLSAPALKLHTREQLMERYEVLLKNSGYTPDKGGALEYLRAVPADRIVKMKAKGIGAIAQDDVIFRPGQVWPDAPLAGWVSAIMIGTATEEAAFFALPQWRRWHIRTATELYDGLVETLKAVPEFAATLVRAYGVTKPPDDSPESLDAISRTIVQMSSDGSFDMYTAERVAACAGTRTKAYLYHLKQPDTFHSSVLRGWSGHSWAIPFLFYTAPVTRDLASADNMAVLTQDSRDEFLAQHACDDAAALKATADAFSDRVARFMHGLEPWAEFNEDGKSMWFDGADTREVTDATRRAAGGRWHAWSSLDGDAKSALTSIAARLRL